VTVGTVGTGGRDHFRWFNYRANVYSTMRDTPKKAGNPWKTGADVVRERPRASIGTS
jgi:hypothetical protein